jgi:lysophospholipase
MEAVRSREGRFRYPADGRMLSYRLWEPTQQKLLLVIVHGFGEHGGRYDAFAQALAQQGVAVACPDLWGHGRSDGRRGDIEEFGQYLDALESLTWEAFLARSREAGFAVFGHSFGGLLAIHWALRQPKGLRRLAIQSPLLGVGFPVPKWKEQLLRSLGGFCRRLQLPTGLNPAWLSHDPSIVRDYRRDPLVHRLMSLRFYQMLQDAMRQAHEQASRLTRPMLLLYGTEDRVISVKACQAFFEQLTCEKRAVEFPGSYHELHHEPAKPLVIEEVLRWVQAHA